jgi:hypothetical protein
MTLESKFDWKKLINVDIPKSEIAVISYGERGSVRYISNKELEIYKAKVRSIPLP